MDQALPLIDRRTWTRRDGPLWQKAYDALLRMIQQRELPSDSPVVESQLAQRLGISRTPLRQALLRLELEGRLRKTVNHSYVVRHVELKEYLQSLRVRQVLEAEAAALSAARVPVEKLAVARANLHDIQKRTPYSMPLHWASDDEIHNLFIDSCGNETMAEILRSLRVTTNLFEIERLSERLIPDTQQHEQILDALEASDDDAARRAVREHIESLIQFAIHTVS